MNQELNNITVQKSILPVDDRFKTIQVDDCKTIADVVNKFVPYYFEGCKFVVTVNNVIIYNDWDKYYLQPNDIVGLNFIPTGGGGGSGKQIAAISVTVLLSVAAFALAGPLGTAVSAWAVSSGLAATAAAGSIVANVAVGLMFTTASILSTMASTAIMGTPEQSQTEEGSKFIEGASNTIDYYGVIPLNLGTNRIFPKQGALPYTETVGDENYVRQMFCYGYGKLKIEDRKFGDTDLSVYTDYELEDKINEDLNTGLTLYPGDVYQTQEQVEMRYQVEHIRTTQRNTSEVIVDITLSHGLYYTTSKSEKRSYYVKYAYYYSKTGEDNWILLEDYKLESLISSTHVVSRRFVFDEPGQYDIKIFKNSVDDDREDNFDDSYFTGLKSISYINPVNEKYVSGTAIRMRASNQLSGSIDSYNVLASTYLTGYNPETDQWEENRLSSNPADIFRYVLQCNAFVKRLPDNRIDLEKLKEWWIYCNEQGFTYDRYVDYDVNVITLLNDICAAGMATIDLRFNIYGVIIDNEKPIVKGLVTPRNSWNYKGNIIYAELPHALRINFRNKDMGYETDERIVYADGYDETTATLYERIEFLSCTNSDLAYYYGRRYLATAVLQTETHTFDMDFENLTFNRGDRIQLINDVILVGVGQGRIKELIVDDVDNPTVVNGFTIDDTLTIPIVTGLGVRIRDKDGSGVKYYGLQNTSGTLNEFRFIEPVPFNDCPKEDSLCAFSEDGKELDLLIKAISMSKDHSASITCVNYAPERFEPLGEIPPFESNITLSDDFYAPYPPKQRGNIISDESVMIRNIDGSITSLMFIGLQNDNKIAVTPIVQYRESGTNLWKTPTMISQTANDVKITGLIDGIVYDFQIRYQAQTGQQLLSQPLVLNGVQYVGGSTPPTDVQNFRITITNGLGLFEWQPNTDVDLSHYIIKYNDDVEGVTWETSQPLLDDIRSNLFTTPIRKGTYMIKAVDLTGNESKNASYILSIDDGAYINVVEILQQETDWSGVKDGCYRTTAGTLEMNDDVTEAFYYFNRDVDLGQVFECSMSYILDADVSDVGLNIRTLADIRSLSNIRNMIETNWGVNIEMNLSNDDVNWTGWQRFKSSQQSFRFAKFRLHMFTEDERTVVFCKRASVEVDMPDRYESGEDVLITDAELGKTIQYITPFYSLPAVNVTIQNAQQGDLIQFTNKDNLGFTIKVFNDISNQYVIRSFDYISAGYGKVIKTIGS